MAAARGYCVAISAGWRGRRFSPVVTRADRVWSICHGNRAGGTGVEGEIAVMVDPVLSTGTRKSMNSQVVTQPLRLTRSAPVARLSDYAQLVRPKIAAMVLVTALLGMFLANRSPDGLSVTLMLIGTALVTAGASTFNQFVERRSDARMKRTASRPLPAGRLNLTEVVLFGLLTTVSGLI